MEKKYQFFISSTYEDLKEERNKAIQAILTMNQFAIGMEMFSAANDDQWKIIKEAIDSSDFYILIIGNRYGSIEETTGISYTEKEFDYAVERKIPVLAFIVDSSVSMIADKFETDSQKISKLNAFKEKVKQSGCQTAHCGRCKPRFVLGEFTSPIVPYRNLPQTPGGMTADCRSLV